MTDTSITLTPSSAATSGVQTVLASAALFTADDIGRLLAMKAPAPTRVQNAVYAAGVIFYSSFAGVDRLYRVVRGGTTHVEQLAGTTPNYDLYAPREAGAGIIDGTCILLYLGQGQHCWGWGTITAVPDSTHASVDVNPKGPFASAVATMNWRMGEFSDVRGWPRVGLFSKGRLWLGGSIARPQTTWGSETGNFPSFSPSEPDGTVLDTNAITETLDDDQLNTILWMSIINRGLVLGAASGEFTLGTASTTTPMSPSNAEALRRADRGSSEDIPGIRIGSQILFAEPGGGKVRQLEYDFGSDSFTTIDLTMISEHITGTGIVDAAYQRRPSGTLWMVRDDGVLISLTFDREQKVRAWCRHVLGGTDTVVESVCCVPDPAGKRDDVYVSVARTIGGATVRTIEFIRAPFRAEFDNPWLGFFVDCGLSYIGDPVSTFSGLDHLEGETVWICADGSVRENRVVTAGSVSITGPAASIVHIGLPYTYRLTTLPLEASSGAAQGTSQGKAKRIHQVTLRLHETGGGRVGRVGGQFDALTFREVGDRIGKAVPLFTGDKRLPFPEGWDREGQLTIEQATPLPITVLAIIYEMVTNG